MIEKPPSEQIPSKVAEIYDCDEVELPPLYNTVDPEQLDALVESMTNGILSFTYSGHDIIVTSGGTVTLAEQRAATHKSKGPEDTRAQLDM